MFFASIASILTPLALLACPVGMGVMMWMMIRGGKKHPVSATAADRPASLEVLREEQRRLDVQINYLESDTGATAGADGGRR